MVGKLGIEIKKNERCRVEVERIPFENVIARLIKLLGGIGKNMQMAKGGQRHGLQLTSDESTCLIERGEAIFPEVVTVVGVKVLQESPVEVSVAFGKELQILQTTLHQLCTAKVGG